MKRKVILIIFILLLAMQLTSFSDNQNIIIGIYPNPPLVGYDDNNEPTGFFVEIMDYIASIEGWTLTYELDFLNETLNKVDNQEVDMMLAVAYTEERDERFIYNEETLYTNWGHIYTNKSQEINSFSDLEGKTIGVEKGDVHYVGASGIKNTLEAFNIHAFFVEYDERVQLLEALEKGEIESAVVSRLFGAYYESDYDIVLTPIQFNPIEIKIITCKEENKALLSIIDEDLVTLKADKKSLYYEQLDALVGIRNNPVLEKEIKIILLLLLTALSGAAIAIGVYRRTIEKQKDSIETQNKLLRQIISNITELNSVSKMDQLFRLLVEQLKELIDVGEISLVSLMEYEDGFYIDEEAYIEGPLAKFAGCHVSKTPIANEFASILSKMTVDSMEIHFDEERILVPYNNSLLTRGYIYLECEKCIEKKELFKLYMANILMDLKAIIYNIMRNREQTQLFMALGELIEKRDNAVAHHVTRVAEGSKILAKACGYDEEAVDNIIIASSVHDIGKIYVPDEVLNYPGKLSPEQFEIIKTHATDGFKIFDNVNEQLSKMVHDVVRHHHENWDGTGYPEGLKRKEIPHVARIVSIIDVFEALTHARPYKDPWPFEEAVQFVVDNSGEKFDPDLIPYFEENSAEIMAMFRTFPDN